MMRRVISAALALGSIALSAPASAEDPSHLATARAVVEASHAKDTMRQIIPTMLAQLRPMVNQQAGNNTKKVDELFGRLSETFNRDLDGVADLIAQVYAREFSEQDLQTLLAFYQTPTGQNLIAKQPIIAQGMMTVGQQWGQQMAKQVLEDFSKKKAGTPKL